MTGPVAACCGKPYKQCTCPRPADTPGLFRGRKPQAAERQAIALESIATNLTTLIQHLCPDAVVASPVADLEPAEAGPEIPETGTEVDEIRRQAARKTA